MPPWKRRPAAPRGPAVLRRADVQRALPRVGLVLAVVGFAACEGEPDPETTFGFGHESERSCADVRSSVARYQIQLEVGGPDATEAEGTIRLIFDKDRSSHGPRMAVTLRCADSQIVTMPPADHRAGESVGLVHFDELSPVELTCDLTLDNPSVDDGSGCLPWFLHVEAQIVSGDILHPFVAIEVLEEPIE